MKRIITYGAIALCILASPASASCFADYKAKKDNPLQLHYGVIELPNSVCGSKGAAKSEISDRLQGTGWTLLNVLSIFDASESQKRRASAGQFFLRY